MIKCGLDGQQYYLSTVHLYITVYHSAYDIRWDIHFKCFLVKVGQSYKTIGKIDFRNAFEKLDNLGFLECLWKFGQFWDFRNASQNLDNKHKQQNNWILF